MGADNAKVELATDLTENNHGPDATAGETDSAVIEVQNFLFSGDNELVDSRSDFDPNKHSPHNRSREILEAFEFDHAAGAPHERTQEAADAESVHVSLDPNLDNQRNLDHHSKNAQNLSHNATQNKPKIPRNNTDESLSSFFMDVPYVSSERKHLQWINSQLDSDDAYSLVSESDYSLAVEGEASRTRLRDLESRETEAQALHRGNEDDLNSEWKNTLWNQTSLPDPFQSINLR